MEIEKAYKAMSDYYFYLRGTVDPVVAERLLHDLAHKVAVLSEHTAEMPLQRFMSTQGKGGAAN